MEVGELGRENGSECNLDGGEQVRRLHPEVDLLTAVVVVVACRWGRQRRGVEVDAFVARSCCGDGKVGAVVLTTTFVRFAIDKEGVSEVKIHLSENPSTQPSSLRCVQPELQKFSKRPKAFT